MKRSYPESALHKAVASYLKLVLCGNSWWTSIAHGEGGGKIRGAMWKVRGAKAGVPDILIVSNGWCYFIELKSEGGYLTPIQKECHRAIEVACAKVAVCRSIDDVAQSLTEWGIRTRDSNVTKRAA